MTNPAAAKLAQFLQEMIDSATANTEAMQPARYVTVALASTQTGFTERAIRNKIADGTWVQGREWKRAPDGRVLIDLQGYEKWVEKVVA